MIICSVYENVQIIHIVQEARPVNLVLSAFLVNTAQHYI